MLTTASHQEPATDASYAIEYQHRRSQVCGEGAPAFTLCVADEAQL
jgi:hypothetical protein